MCFVLISLSQWVFYGFGVTGQNVIFGKGEGGVCSENSEVVKGFGGEEVGVEGQC